LWFEVLANACDIGKVAATSWMRNAQEKTERIYDIWLVCKGRPHKFGLKE
jgi:hypothetical protein